MAPRPPDSDIFDVWVELYLTRPAVADAAYRPHMRARQRGGAVVDVAQVTLRDLTAAGFTE